MQKNSVLLFFTLLALIACAPFSGKEKSGESAQLSTAWLNGEITEEEYYELLEAETVNDPYQYDSESEEAFYKIQKTASVKYDLISKVVIEALKQSLTDLGFPEDCKKKLLDPYSIGNGHAYNCGEIPYGDLMNKQEKKIFSMDFESMRGKADDVEYSVKGFHVPLIADRNQFKGKAKISDLNFQKPTQIDTSDALFRSTYIKIQPNTNSAQVAICTFVPGMRVKSRTIKTSGDFKKKQWGFIPLKTEGTFEVNPGALQFENARLCGAILLKYNQEESRMEQEIIGFEAPVFKGLKHTGLKTNSRFKAKGLLKVINWFTRIFGFNIEKKLAETANEEIKKFAKKEYKRITTEEIKNGLWLKRVFEEDFLNRYLVKNLDKALRDKMAEEGPGQPITFERQIGNLCGQAFKDLPDPVKERMEEICEVSVFVRVGTFVPNETYQQRGCYSHYFNPFEAEIKDLSPWWEESCGLANEISIEVPKIMVPLYDCFIEQVKKNNIEDTLKLCELEVDYTTKALETREDLEEYLLKRARWIRKELDRL